MPDDPGNCASLAAVWELGYDVQVRLCSKLVYAVFCACAVLPGRQCQCRTESRSKLRWSQRDSFPRGF